MSDQPNSLASPRLQPVPRARHWRLRSRTLEFSISPLWMGILNVTPDSFSDGGQFLDVERAVAHGLDLVEQGAAILDIGGESTRPHAAEVSVDEELSRVMPVVERLAAQTDCPISIDTSKAAVARHAIESGAEIINDVTGLTGDAQMVPLAVETGAGICAMHMPGTPRTMQDDPSYDDVVSEVAAYLRARRDALLAAGVAADRICLDPGIGFGKRVDHNVALMRCCWRLHELGCPLLVGHSRKRFLGRIIGDDQADRMAATIGGTLALARQGVQIVRLHNVRAARQALLAFEASGGLTSPVPPGVG